MLGKYAVKKPYTVIVGVILVLILGVISFTHMTTDLLPNMNFPYVIVYTTYVGATPEQVEDEVTRPMEAAFATLTDIKDVSSQSSDNLSLVVLEFNDTADMNTAMIEINSEITTLSATWSDSIGAPAIMKINPDMLPVSIVSVVRDDMDILELSRYVEEELAPQYEAINGVASVTASGVITQEVDVTIDQSRIDVLNSAILRDIDAQLADAEAQLNDAQAQISDGKSELARAKKQTLGQISDGMKQLESGEAQLSQAVEQLTAQRAELVAQQKQLEEAIAQLEKLTGLTDEERALLAEMEKQLGNLKAEKDRLQEQLDKLEPGQTGDALNQQRAEAVARRAELAAEKDRYERYLADLNEADPAKIQSEIESLNGQIAAKQSEVAAAQSALDAAADECAQAQSHVDELKRLLGEQEPTAAPTASAEPTTDPEASATAAPDATASAEETAAPAETASAEPTDGSTAVPEASPAAADDATTAPADAAAQSAKTSLFAAQAEERTPEELREELAQAEATLAEKQSAMEQAQKALDEKNAELKSLNDQLAQKQKALDEIQGENLQSRRDEAQREIDRLNARIAAVDLEIAGIDQAISGGDEAIEEMKKSLAQLDEAIAKIENSDEYKALKLALDKDELNRQYAAAVEGKAQLDAGIAQIDAMLEKLNAGIIPGGMIEGVDEDTSIADARAQLESGRKQAEDGFAQAEAQLSDAEAQLSEARAEFEEKRDEALKNAGLDGVITLQTVGGILGAQNMSMPAGYVYDVSENQYLVRVGDKFASLDELKTMKLFHVGSDSVEDVRLMDVATVEITDNSADTFTKFNGKDGILLSIEKQSTFSTTDVSKSVAAKNAELTGADSALSIIDLFNQGDYITIIVDSVLNNLVSGGLLAVLILLIFLMDYRPTIIIAFSIPLSVVIAFVCMYFTGITLNVLSLSGLALGVGMLVDNSIVAIENIYRLRDEQHLPILTACIEGVRQISGALFSSTLTTVCVFLPVLFVTGLARDLFSDIGLVITYSLLASLLVAMTLVPTMAASLLKKQKKVRRQPVFSAIQRGYVRLLRGALRFKPLVLLAAVALLAVTVLQVPGMGMSFMPSVNSTQMTGSLPWDSKGDETQQREQAVELMNRIMAVDGISAVGLNSGGTSAVMSSGSELSYYMIVDSDAGRSNAAIARDIRAIADDMSLDFSVQTSTMDISMLTGSGISVNITGPEVEQLRAIAADVAEIVRSVDGAAEVDDGLENSVPELSVTVDKEKAIDKNLTVGQVLQFVATKIAGKTEISQATLNGRTLSIYLIDGRNSDITPENLEDLEIEVTSGDKSEMVRIGDIAEIAQTQSMGTIRRQQQQRVVTVSFAVAEGYSANHVSDALEAKLADYAVPDGYAVALAGENETVMSIAGDLVFMVIIAVVLIFLIMVAQFQSFKSPVIVMFTIPLAFTGGLAALLITGLDLSIVAMVGFLVLSGVVVNNGIVFVDCVNQLRIGGMTKREALLETGRIRLRPILMTALTTILGMSTMALATGMGAEMMQPMAVVTIGGLSYATLMTLFVVPAMYDLFNGERMSAREIEMAKESMGLSDGEDAASTESGAKDAVPADNAAKDDSPAKAAADAPEESGEANADLPNATAEEPRRCAAADASVASAKAQPENLSEAGRMNPVNPSVNAAKAVQTNCPSAAVRPGALPAARRADGAASLSNVPVVQPAARPMPRGGMPARRASASRRDEKRRRVQRKLDR